ncbi:MAG: 1-acyl-sn-glycerol-3-phosphate acyltransferase [Planctomycetes bacterium]|nr:1-acyl-sn-glycerol-3-phosphate acyltransferase [Planctomycetota bacterium]
MMSPETTAKIAIAGFAAVAAALIVRDMLRWEIGYKVWVLYALNRVYGAFFFHPRYNRRCPFPENGPALIIANHRSAIDPLVIWLNHHLSGPNGKIRMIRFMMAREYMQVPGVGWITRTACVIPADRNGRDSGPAREALRAMQNGHIVALFPEGRINKGTDLLPVSTGIAWLALRAKVLVYPVYLRDSPQEGGMLGAFCRFSRVKVAYGDPIDLSRFSGQRKSQEILREVTDLMMDKLASLGGVKATPSEPPEETEARVLPLKRATG